MRGAAKLARWLALGALAALCACSQPPVPQDHFYRLSVPPPQGVAADALPEPLSGGIVQVERFTADGLTSNRAIVYSDADQGTVAQTYHYHFWNETPAILLQTALVEYLRKAGARKVVTPDLRVQPDVVIAGRIRAFEQVRGDPGLVRAAMEIAVSDYESGRLLHLGTYAAEEATASDALAHAAERMSLAVGRIFAEFVRDLQRAE